MKTIKNIINEMGLATTKTRTEWENLDECEAVTAWNEFADEMNDSDKRIEDMDIIWDLLREDPEKWGTVFIENGNDFDNGASSHFDTCCPWFNIWTTHYINATSYSNAFDAMDEEDIVVNPDYYDPSTIKSIDEAREIAIAWQSWQGEHSMSYEEYDEWNEFFNKIVEMFPALYNEFTENAII